VSVMLGCMYQCHIKSLFWVGETINPTLGNTHSEIV
jgi:hypothetical protein